MYDEPGGAATFAPLTWSRGERGAKRIGETGHERDAALIMLGYLKLTGRPVIGRGGLTTDDEATERRMPLWIALSPWVTRACA